MPQKILVTGATGFVGRHVVEELSKRGEEVVASSRTQPDSDFPESVTFIPYDLMSPTEVDLYEYFSRPDRIIHLAWSGLPNYTSSFHIEENLPAHQHFLDNLVRNGLKHVTVAGTCMEYGMQEGELIETDQAKPENEYSRAKDGLRRHLESLQSNYNFQLCWVRMFYMYGEGQNPKSLHSQLISAIRSGAAEFDMSPGDQLRDFLPVEEVARILVEIALQDKFSGIINCCSGKPISVEDFINEIMAKHGVQLKLNKGKFGYSNLEPRNFWGSTKKLETIIGNGSN